jgi:uncharacterized membrane protein
MQVEDRIAALEERTRALEAHVGLAPTRPARETVPAPAAAPLAAARFAGIAAPPRRFSGDLEDLVGGRLLAWVGGLAVTLGVIFLLAIAVSRGWIGEVERTVLAGLLSGGLLAAGIRLHGRRGRTDAAKAATAAGIVGLFATALVAGSVYHLVPALVALVAAIAVGATATALAVRWEVPGIAALGIVGALASPALFDTLHDADAIVLLFVATASATGVLLWQRWTWLAFAAFAIATPQWITFVRYDNAELAVMIAFGALTAMAAVGFEVRVRADAVRIGSILLLALNALVLALVGVVQLDHPDAWLVALALAHIAVGVGGRRTTRISPDLAMAGLALGVVLADIAAARMLDGLPLVLGWAAGGALFAGLTRLAVPGLDRHAALVGLGGHMALALAGAVLVAPAGSVTGQIALIAVAATSLISGRLAEEGRTELRMVLDAIALALVAYVTVTGLDDLRLTLALAAQTFGLIMIARHHREDPIALGGAVAFAALTALHAVIVLAPGEALVEGLDHPLEALAGLGATTVVVALLGLINPEWRTVTRGAAALFALYGASVELVTAFAGTPQLAQALLSALWAATGVGTLIAGLVRDSALLRHAALALLAITAGKVFMYDLASLDSLSRVGSFIALGLLLLAGAFAWQRIRPRPLPDLRQMPGSLR